VSYFSGFLKALTAFQTIQNQRVIQFSGFGAAKVRRILMFARNILVFFVGGVIGVIGVIVG
jgi:hypothetical protein